jgi:response regulator RpfG family c-di-GMP phosphodiesterase
MAKLTFKAKSEPRKTEKHDEYWGILVVDDDPEVHKMTRFVMKDWQFEGRSIRLISASSGQEAREILASRDDISVILLDVVMESEDSGLQLVRYIRETLNNSLIRIILRTGQPGRAPVRKILKEYEINDYKEKNELTADRLYVAVTASLRNYRDLLSLERNRQGMKSVLKATRSLLSLRNINSFADHVLLYAGGLMDREKDSLFLQFDSDLPGCEGRETPCVECIKVLSGTGRYRDYSGKSLRSLGLSDINALAIRNLERKESFYEGGDYIGYFPISNSIENILILRGMGRVSEFKKHLMRIYSANAEMAMTNLYLTREVEETQRDVICTLGEVVESRSQETANHIRRVTDMAVLLGRSAGMDENALTLLQLAAPMHDVGKIGIPDEILHKPGRLNTAEFELMKTHTVLGAEILDASERPVMKTAGKIALDHHERWDGTGYPYRKTGDEISLEGRIIAIVDVFDALYNRRIYKEPWPLEQILSLYRDERGGHFDPDLTDRFLSIIDDIVALQTSLKDG